MTTALPPRDAGPVPRRPLSSFRGGLLLCVALGVVAALATLPACHHRYGVEDREAPVYVWIDVPAARTADQTVELVVTVGGRQAANGTYIFPAGRTRQEMPPLYLHAGNHPVVVTRGGQVVAEESIPVGHVTWLVVTIDGAKVTIARSKVEPGTYR